jgi:hypothetical protein
VDREGTVHVIELKRDRTPREVVAQALDYGSWVRRLSYEDIATLYAEKNGGTAFETAFSETFGTEPPESLNETHKLVIVATELDPSTERIIDYLAEDYGVPVNAVFFQHFQDGENAYLARSWLIDPADVQDTPAKKSRKGGSKEPWNGRDYYVAIGEDQARNWEDCVKYGFVCGGGGKWYSQSLYQLAPGARVFACIPKTGYVGVGTVTEAAVPFRDFRVTVDGREKRLDEVPLKAPNMAHHLDDDETCEHVVGVKWQHTLPREQAFWETGMYANQNTATKLRNAFTLDRLYQRFNLEE